MNMYKTITVCLLLACAVAPLTVIAQEQPQAATTTTRELVDTRLADLKERLALSDYTWEQVHLILKTSIRERIAIGRKYGLDGGDSSEPLSSKEKRQMRRELKSNRKATANRMERYLDKDQMKEFKRVQEEIHAEVLARLESREEQLASSASSTE